MRSNRYAIVAAASSLVGFLACGSSGSDSTFGDGNGNGANLANGTVNDDGNLQGSSGGAPADGVGACTNLQCKQVACPNGGTTSFTGTVLDPSGSVPIYNAIVYVPNTDIDAFTPGVTCDQCGTSPSGQPIATALTDAAGRFELKNVPVGVEVPVVIQIGRWRRKVTVPAIAACGTSEVDAGLTRLPRNKREGDIPKIAIATGGADSLECFLRKIGIEDAEITNPTGDGRVHLYQGLRSGANGSMIDANTPSAQTLWNDVDQLKKYDMVILSCEGGENTGTKTVAARNNVKAYLDQGGRVFASHFHYVWYKLGPSEFSNTATWQGTTDEGNQDVMVDTSFAKGEAFSSWLTNVGATKAPATVAMTEVKATVVSVPGAGQPATESRQWLYRDTGTTHEPKFYTFNAPIGKPAEQQCGRGVYTDIHVSSGDGSGGTFPNNCTTSGLTGQEKSLLFLLMDLAACIQDDAKAPTPPPPVIK